MGAKYHRVWLSAPGALSRLHTENHGAHCWLTQIEGRRVVFLFSPREAAKLHADDGEVLDLPEGYAARASGVDIFHPSAKRHVRFREAKAYVVTLRPGMTLVIPSGWWRLSVALEPSVTLH